MAKQRPADRTTDPETMTPKERAMTEEAQA